MQHAMRTYLALGDSISIDDYTGVPGGGAPSQLARKLGVELADLTRDGNTTEGVLGDLARAPAAADVVTLSAGGNDLLLEPIPLGAPVDRPPGDERTGEMKHCQVSVGPLLPANEDAAEAMQPGVGALDHPAAGAEAGLAFERLRLLAAGANVGGEAELGRELTHLGVVVAAVEAEPLR
jgi:GDSL-like Lipase/Acylhydrolase family